MSIVSHYLQDERDRLNEVCNLVISESVLMYMCEIQEVFQRQLQTTTDGKKRKQLQDEILLTKAEKELAHSKAVYKIMK